MPAKRNSAVTSNEAGDQMAELSALQRMLKVSQGTSSLAIAVCNSPSLRDYLVGRIHEQFPCVTLVTLPQECIDVFGEVMRQLDNSVPEAMFVVGIEQSIASTADHHPTLKSLNASRDLWEHHLPCPIVFWVPAYVVALLPLHAPDFWRYRSHTFEFAADALEFGFYENGPFADDLNLNAGNLDADRKQFRITELVQRLQDIGKPIPKGLAPTVAIWMDELGFLYQKTGNYTEAERYALESVEIGRSTKDLEGLTVALGNLGVLREINGDSEGAERFFRDALVAAQKSGEVDAQARHLGNIGVLAMGRGDLDEAKKFYRESLNLYRERGNSRGEANLLGNLGTVEAMRGNFGQAAKLMHAALAIDRELGYLEGQAARLGNLGRLAQDQGDLDQASCYYSESMELSRRLGEPRELAAQLGNLGAVSSTRGEMDQALRCFVEALEIGKRIGDADIVLRELGNLGVVAYDCGDIDKARGFWTSAREILSQIGDSEGAEAMQQRMNQLTSGVVPTHELMG